MIEDVLRDIVKESVVAAITEIEMSYTKQDDCKMKYLLRSSWPNICNAPFHGFRKI